MKKIVATVLICLMMLSLCACRSEDSAFKGCVVDTEVISQLDAEFAEFIGPDHMVDSYTYVRYPLNESQTSTDVGYGPLSTFDGFAMFVGNNGSIAVIAYGSRGQGVTSLYAYELPDTEAVVLVLDGCVAPESWWNRALATTTLYNVITTDGMTLSHASLIVPLKEGFGPDSAPYTENMSDGQYWCWNGTAYAVAAFVDTNEQEPVTHDSQTLSHESPARGSFLCA